MEEIRTLNDHEIDDALELSAYAFQYELTDEMRRRKRNLTNPDEVWGYFVDGTLAAKLQIMPLSIYIHGQVFDMGGIAKVATWPEYRRHGMVGKLMSRSLTVMKKKGMTLSLLHPFSFSFYRKYGWETYIDHKQYILSTEQLPPKTEDVGIMKRITDPMSQWLELQQIYDPYARAYNGMLARDEKWWTTELLPRKSGVAAVHYTKAGEPDGYLLYDVKNRIMDIKEMVYLDESARKALWSFIANHDSMIEKVKVTAPVNDPFAFTLPDPQIEQSIAPYFMARIVDVRNFLLQYPFCAPKRPVKLEFFLNDQHAEWNHGKYTLTIDQSGQTSIEVVKEGRTDTSCDIQTLTALLMGYQTPEMLKQIGKWNLSSEQLLQWKQVLPTNTPYLLDFF